MIRKPLIIILLLFFIIPVVSAHTEEMGEMTEMMSGHEEEGLSHQIEEILPFHHFSEGHIFAGVVLVIFWISFIYLIYNLIQLLLEKKR